ncbi:MAG: universal stress protein [Acetobacteraceae bacterium]
MQPRDIMVVLDGTQQSMVMLGVSTGLARRFGARLEAVCPLSLLAGGESVGEDSGIFGTAGTGGLLAPLGPPEEVAAPSPDSPPERAERIGVAFREELRRNGLDGDFLSTVGRPGEAVAKQARTADLVVLGQPEPDQAKASAHRNMVEDVLMTSGRPVLMIPFAGEFTTVGRNVLIGWVEGPEAARAAHEALVLATPGAKLTVLTVRRGAAPEDQVELPGADIARHLARHGFDVEADETVARASLPPSFIVRPAVSEADALLNYATDRGADLLAVGCYGHSRTRERVLGGVTRDLLSHMTLPVLMSR